MIVGKSAAFGAVLLLAASFTVACKTTQRAESGVLDTGAEAVAPAGASNPDAERIHAEVRAALASKHGRSENSTWADTSGALPEGWIMQSPSRDAWDWRDGNAIPNGASCKPGQAYCDPQFKLWTCRDDNACAGKGMCRPLLASVKKPGDQPVSMCVGFEDHLVDQIYQAMIKAKETIDIVSLVPPNDRYLEAMKNALVFLDHSGARPSVRMLYAGANGLAPTTISPENYVKKMWLSDLLKMKPNFTLKISAAWLSHLTSWNHVKVINIDGKEAMVGGMNWVSEYLTPMPVFDLSMSVTGAAATASLQFIDVLWASSQVEAGAASAAGGRDPQMKHAREGMGEPGPVKMIGAGRLGNQGDDAADTALAALTASSKKVIRIVQQDLYGFSLSGPFGLAGIVDAILNGVDVYVIKSGASLTSGYKIYSPEQTFDWIGRAVEKKAGKGSFFRGKGTYYRPVCEHLHLAPMHYSPANPADSKVPLHSKLVMVDDVSFYLGSHNMYKANLQEYGYFVFDKGATDQLIADYWEPMWRNSEPYKVACKAVD